MEGVRLYTVDAFAAAAFEGNPAAVVLVEEGKVIGEEDMKKLAAEMNLSETAFVQELPGSSFKEGQRFGLRWMTPTVEVNLCGHATLATSKVLFDVVGNTSHAITFETLSGPLVASREGDLISIDLPRNDPEVVDGEPYSALIKVVVGELAVSQCFYSAATKKLGLHLKDSVSRAELEVLRPDTVAMVAASAHGSGVTGVIVTMAGAGKPGKYDVLSRYFAPWNGIPEDPVTGSAHTVLGPYWMGLLGRPKINARQCSPRGGDIAVTVKEDKVAVAGTSYVVLRGAVDL